MQARPNQEQSLQPVVAPFTPTLTINPLLDPKSEQSKENLALQLRYVGQRILEIEREIQLITQQQLELNEENEYENRVALETQKKQMEATLQYYKNEQAIIKQNLTLDEQAAALRNKPEPSLYESLVVTAQKLQETQVKIQAAQQVMANAVTVRKQTINNVVANITSTSTPIVINIPGVPSVNDKGEKLNYTPMALTYKPGARKIDEEELESIVNQLKERKIENVPTPSFITSPGAMQDSVNIFALMLNIIKNSEQYNDIKKHGKLFHTVDFNCRNPLGQLQKANQPILCTYNQIKDLEKEKKDLEAVQFEIHKNLDAIGIKVVGSQPGSK